MSFLRLVETQFLHEAAPRSILEERGTISASSFDPPSGAAAPDGHREGPDRQIRFVFGARPQPLGGAVDKQVGDLVRRFPILVSLRSQVLQFCARYQRLTIHFAPTTVSQTTANSIVSTTTAISRAIKSRSPSSSDIGE